MFIRDYIMYLVLQALNLSAMAFLAFSSQAILQESLIILLLLLLTILFMYGIYKEEEWGYGIAAIVFALGLVNTIYLYTSIVSYIVVFLVFFNALGFIISVTRVRLFEDRKRYFSSLFMGIDLNKEFKELSPEAEQPKHTLEPLSRAPTSPAPIQKFSIQKPRHATHEKHKNYEKHKILSKHSFSKARKPSTLRFKIKQYTPPHIPQHAHHKHHIKHIDDFTQHIEKTKDLFEGIPKLDLPDYSQEPTSSFQSEIHKQKTKKQKSTREDQLEQLRKVFSDLSNEVNKLETQADKLEAKAKKLGSAPHSNRQQGVIQDESFYYDQEPEMLRPRDDFSHAPILLRKPKTDFDFMTSKTKDNQIDKKIDKRAQKPVDADELLRDLEKYYEEGSKAQKQAKTNVITETKIIKRDADTKVIKTGAAVKVIKTGVAVKVIKTGAADEGNIDEGKIEIIQAPGKFVSSEFGRKYHVPECETAKRITISSRVWFDSAQNAKKQGYDACNCVKKREPKTPFQKIKKTDSSKIKEIKRKETKNKSTKNKIMVYDGTAEVIRPSGRFVGSEFGKKYHTPECKTANRISKSSRIWFGSAKSAKLLSYDACECIGKK